MKKALSFLLFAVAFLSNAQVEQFQKLDSLQFEKAKENIIKLTGRNYVKDPEEIGFYNGKLTNEYINSDKNTDKFSIITYKFKEGKNLALEIEGVTKYSIDMIRGPFLAVYPFWLKYIDESANRDKIIKEGRASTPKDRFIRMYQLSNDTNDWILDF